jgi:hypothetical protein
LADASSLLDQKNTNGIPKATPTVAMNAVQTKPTIVSSMLANLSEKPAPYDHAAERDPMPQTAPDVYTAALARVVFNAGGTES